MQDYPLDDLQYDYEPSSMQHTYYGFRMSTRDLARFGLLFLRKGRWQDRQVVPVDWVRDSTATHSDTGSGGYGYMWWTGEGDGLFPNVKVREHSYYASGFRGHKVIVLPYRNLVIVHRVNTFSPEGQVSGAEFGYLVRLILAAGPDPLPEGDPDAAGAVELSEAEVTSLVGRYTLSRTTEAPPGFTPPQEVSIERCGEDIVAAVPGQLLIVLAPVTPTRLRSTTDESYAEIEIDGHTVESVTFVVDDTIAMVYRPTQ